MGNKNNSNNKLIDNTNPITDKTNVNNRNEKNEISNKPNINSANNINKIGLPELIFFFFI